MPAPTPTVLPWTAVVTLTAAALAAVIAGLARSPGAALSAVLNAPLALAVGFLSVGVFLIRQRPRLLLSTVTWLIGLLAATSAAALLLPAGPVGTWVEQWAWWPPLGLLPLGLLLFPDAPDRGTLRYRTAKAVTATVALGTLLLMAAALSGPPDVISNPTNDMPRAIWALQVAAFACVLATAVAMVIALAALARRAARTSGRERYQYYCLLPSAALFPIGAVVEASYGYGLAPAALALPIGLGVAILEYHFDDLDFSIARGSVRLLLIFVSVLLYAGVLLWIGALIPGSGATPGPVLFLAILAGSLDPVRRRLQRAADRWLFGRRAEPYAVLTALGEQMQSSPEPRAMLANATSAVVTSLNVPYARIVLTDGPRGIVLAESGRPGIAPVPFPMELPDKVLGYLEVSPRRHGEKFRARESRLLAQVARQAALAAQAHQLNADLHAARERLVFSREEERLRLRRDLHDGLGPVLAGTRMQLAAALRLLQEGRAATMVTKAFEDLGGAGRTVRELIDGLRPAALDLGLDVALRQAAEGIVPAPAFSLHMPSQVGPLQPAVEVAAFRIGCEAMNNVARHSEATRCELVLTATADTLRLEVADNGIGAISERGPGVGMASMAARAEELGGTLNVDTGSGGTRVIARLPLHTNRR